MTMGPCEGYLATEGHSCVLEVGHAGEHVDRYGEKWFEEADLLRARVKLLERTLRIATGRASIVLGAIAAGCIDEGTKYDAMRAVEVINNAEEMARTGIAEEALKEECK